MAKDNQVRMPSSMAGITQYFEEGESIFVLSPKAVMILIILVSVGLVALQFIVPLQ